MLALVCAADDPVPLHVRRHLGRTHRHGPRRYAGFGYDPVFLVVPLGRTVAQLAPEEKNALSHRAQALHQLVAALRA